MAFRRTATLLLVPIMLGLGVSIQAQHNITLDMDIDTTTWAPVAYLSLIPGFNKLNTIGYSYIIAQSGPDHEGQYHFNTEYLPEAEHLYRIHFSKKGDSHASLIIGGKDHNHFVFIATRFSNFSIEAKSGDRLINHLHFKDYPYSRDLEYVRARLDKLDSIDQSGSRVNSEYAMRAVYDDLKVFADTSSAPLLSLYALYHVNYEEDCETNPQFYRRYLRKWRSQGSAYFKEFRAHVRGKALNKWMIVSISGAVLLFIFLIVYFQYRKNRKKHHQADLSIQERKVFELLRQGKTNKEIAGELNVGVSTVKSHVNSIFSKLRIKSRREIMNIPMN